MTARRNTCLLLLTAGAALSRPDLGLWLVGVWTVATSVFLVIRLCFAWSAWRREPGERLRSWLADIDVGAADAPFTVRVFSQKPVRHA